MAIRRPDALTGEQLGTLKQAAQMGLLSDHLKGKHVVLTGTMSLRRNDMEFLIKLVGGKVDAATGALTNLVVVGDTGMHGRTSKLQEAASRGVAIVSESDLVHMLSVV